MQLLFISLPSLRYSSHMRVREQRKDLINNREENPDDVNLNHSKTIV